MCVCERVGVCGSVWDSVGECGSVGVWECVCVFARVCVRACAHTCVCVWRVNVTVHVCVAHTHSQPHTGTGYTRD